ncbi:hypothetical protein D3C75_1290970 [compost metagenome]
MHLGTNAEAIPGFGQPNRDFDRADANDLLPFGILHNKQIAAIALGKFALPGF